MKLRYTPEAILDLRDMKQYISEELQNPSAALAITGKIVSSASQLKEQPNLGMDLDKKIRRETGLKYIVSGNHLIFYRIDEEYISVIRILDCRTNYIKILFEKMV